MGALSTETPSRLHHALIGRFASVGQRLPRWRVLAPAFLAIAFCLVFVPNVVRNVRAASYVEAAVAEHRSHLDNRLPIALHSDSPALVTTWFAEGPIQFSPAGGGVAA